jgi:hypothetical protein
MDYAASDATMKFTTDPKGSCRENRKADPKGSGPEFDNFRIREIAATSD